MFVTKSALARSAIRYPVILESASRYAVGKIVACLSAMQIHARRSALVGDAI